jgi:hypothetical protein
MKISEKELLMKLQKIDPYQFEQLVADIWEYQGWTTEVTTRSKDGGIDIIARKELPFRQKQYIQAKCRSPRNKISAPKIREYASLNLKNDPDRDQVDSVILVTTGELTKQARDEAAEFNTKVVDGNTLSRMIARWDLKHTVAEYISFNESEQEMDQRLTEINDEVTDDYRGTRNWNMISDYNELDNHSKGFEVVANLEGKIAYKLVHGPNRKDQLNEWINIHILPEISDDQKDRLKYVANDMGLKYRPSDIDGRFTQRIAESMNDISNVDRPEQVKTHRTISIGREIVNRVYGHPFSDVSIEIKRI